MSLAHGYVTRNSCLYFQGEQDKGVKEVHSKIYHQITLAHYEGFCHIFSSVCFSSSFFTSIEIPLPIIKKKIQEGKKQGFTA